MLYLEKVLPELFLSTPTRPFLYPKYQTASDVSALPNGGFAVAWQTTQVNPSVTLGLGVGAGTFDSYGNRTSLELLNGDTSTRARAGFEPSIATLSNGNWAVVWDRASSDIGGATTSTALLSIFTPTGTVIADQIVVRPTASSLSPRDYSSIVITPLPQEQFVATWTQRATFNPTTYEICGQIYSASGQPLGSQFSVETGITTGPTPVITPLAGDRFLSAWTFRDENSQTQIRGQIFDISGAKIGSVLALEVAFQNSANAQVSFASFQNGNFIIVWDSWTGVQAGSEIRAQIFDSSGHPVGQEILVNATSIGDQTDPDVAVLPDGSFVVSWTDASGRDIDVSGTAIRLQHFDQSGNHLGAEDVVNTFLSGAQYQSSLAVIGSDELLVTWTNGSRPVSDTQVVPGIDGQFYRLSSTPQSGQPAHNDINRDGYGDTLFFNDSGVVAAWEMDHGAIRLATGLGSLPANFEIAGTGDFDGDRQSDFLLRDQSGSVAMWEMNGKYIKLASAVGSLPVGFRIAETGDLNGDGRADVVLRNGDGYAAVWLLNGPVVESEVGIGYLPPDYMIEGVADFNGDGRADLLLHNSAGFIALWEMNGASVQRASGVAEIGSDYAIAGVADFNGDMRADILFQHRTGVVSIWLMDGPGVQLAAGVGHLPPGYEIASTGDINGDGRADILLQDKSGFVAAWEMDGVRIDHASGLGYLGADWHLIA